MSDRAPTAHPAAPLPSAVRPPPSIPSVMSQRFKSTLARVIAIQAVALVLLWLLQQRYAG